MTKTERENHIKALNTIIENHGFTANRFGIYHKDQYKIDTRDNNLKIWKEDFKALSKPLIQVTAMQLENYLLKRGI
jgi:hypothetical protein